jgi:cullin 3
MYRVFKRDESTLKYIIAKMGPYITQRGDKIVKDEQVLKDAIDFTQKLLDLKAEMDEMVKKSFQNDQKFQKQRNLSFQEFMNNCNLTPSFIASYCDNEFKKGLKGNSQAEIEAKLDAIIRLFCCLHSRDVFIKCYTKNLSSRLLNKSSISSEAEESMLQKLKVECGHNTVNKMTKMFTDMTLSQDLMKEFRTKSNGGTVNSVDVNAEILTNGFWPEAQKGKCKLPPEIQMCATKFEEFYKFKHQNRNLQWLYQHGSVEITPNFAKNKKYQLVVSVNQACVLSLFNSRDSITFEEVKQLTQISDEELNPALIFVCKPNIKLLLKGNMKQPKFTPTETLKVNMDFNNPNVKLNLIPVPSKKQATSETISKSKEDDGEIQTERRNICDATIVRIMKARKSEMHNELIIEVTKQIHNFVAQPALIKQRIESLIERDYLKRDDDNRAKYIYLP